MKNRKGITLISLVITVIVLAILASIATYSGINVIRSSKFTAFTAELKIMQTHVNAIYEENEEAEYGEAIENANPQVQEQAKKVFTEAASGITNKEGYRYWSAEYIKDNLKIEGVEQSFFVNLEKRSIVSYEGLEYEGRTYYTLEQLPNGLYNADYEELSGTPTFDVKTEEIENDKWRFTISNIQYNGYINKWQVSYQLEGKNYWNTTEDLSFVVEEQGNYKIKLVNEKIESSEKEVVLAREYVKDRLILHYDGINNTGEGDDKHSNTTMTWKDLSGQENNATLNGFNNTETSGWKENRLVFDGEDDWVRLKNIIKNQEAFTIEYVANKKRNKSWEYLWGVKANYFGLESNAADSRLWYYCNNEKKEHVSITDIKGNNNEVVSNTIAINGKLMKIYKNGIKLREIEVENLPSVYTTVGDNFGIGADGDGNYKTMIDYYTFRIYDKALSDAEIRKNYEIDKNRFELSEKLMTVEEAKTQQKTFEAETMLQDNFGNKVVVPEGFKIATDSSDNVTGGVVIEDVSYGETAGSQFVWIPVGTVYKNVNQTENTIITLGRYDFDIATGQPSAYSGSNKEENAKDTANLLKYGNTIAKDIEAFRTSATRNGGYYIGKYEARVANKRIAKTENDAELEKVTVKGSDFVYNYIKQSQAANLSQRMYENKPFTSDLMNSYAWDTAIEFLQEFDNRTTAKNLVYSRQNSLNTSFAEKGTNNLTDINQQDKICNIWDMASNDYEWTTETYGSVTLPCVCRGGGYNDNSSDHRTSNRYPDYITTSISSYSFRVVLYL